jgi:hypothetical protein
VLAKDADPWPGRSPAPRGVDAEREADAPPLLLPALLPYRCTIPAVLWLLL